MKGGGGGGCMQMKGRGGGGVVHANEGEGRGVSLTASSQFIIMHMVHVISILKLQCAQKRSTRRTATEDDPASVRSCLEFSLIAFFIAFLLLLAEKNVFFWGGVLFLLRLHFQGRLPCGYDPADRSWALWCILYVLA